MRASALCVPVPRPRGACGGMVKARRRAAAGAAARGAATADPERIRAQSDRDIGAGAVEKLVGLSHVQISPVGRAAGDEDSATMCVAQELAKLAARRGAELEILDAGRDLTGDADEGITWRLGQAAQARAKAERSQTDDRTEYHISDSGARIKRDERRPFEHLLDAIDFPKRTKPPHCPIS